MFKNYIRKIIKEVLAEPSVDLTEYHTKLFAAKPTFWNILLTRKIISLEFQVDYLDEIKHPCVYKEKFTSITKMNSYFKTPWQDTIPSDLTAITEAKLYVWYKYKDKKELESYRFTKFNQHYRPDMLERCFKVVTDWYIKHPEVLL